ncbi:hypothetical protein ES706_06362 [subsurface metagenome]
MKRKIFSVLFALVLVVSLVVGGVLPRATPVEAQGTIIYVPADNATIQVAVDSASSGDTIIVAANLTDNYTENVDVTTNNLTIQGAGSANTTVEAANAALPVFNVTANNTTIKNFTITGATGSSGVRIDGSNCKIDSDNISGNYNGIQIAGRENRIRRNTITGNSNYGIYFVSSTIGDGWNDVQYNNITGNTKCGAYADIKPGEPYWMQGAGFNYWGDDSGPSGSGPGTGDAVNDYVWYNPWLNDSFSAILASGIADISMAIPLQTGWNTLATPLALTGVDNANRWDQIVTNSGLTYDAAYTYDPDTPAWVELEPSSTTVLNPLDAVFIQMSSPGTVTLKVSIATTPPPTKTLSAGWNLLGSAMAITERELEMWKVLKSVEQTPAGKVGYIMVVSPPLATQPSWVYVRGQEETTGFEWQKMDFGRGYWIYMENIDEMAGFGSTPITARVWD